MKTFPMFVFFSVMLVLTGCTTTQNQPEFRRDDNAALGRASVITRGTPNLDPHLPSTISWIAPIEVVAPVDAAQQVLLKNTVQSTIESQVMHKGYTMLMANGDFQMQALLVFGDNTSDNGKTSVHSDLLQQTGIDPGLTGSPAAPGKGSLIIELRQGHALRWRGAVQIYLLPQSDATLIAQRIQQALAELLSTWP